MKICQVLVSDGWGGAENVVYHLSKKLSQIGEEVVLFISSDIEEMFSNLQRVGIRSLGPMYNPLWLLRTLLGRKAPRIAMRDSTAMVRRYLAEVLRLGYFAKIRNNLLSSILEEEPDIIHVHLENSIKMFLFLDVEYLPPSIVTLHGTEARIACKRHLSLKHSIRRYLLRKALSQIDAFSAVSTDVLRIIAREGILESKPGRVIQNGVDIKGIQQSGRLKLKSTFNLLFPGGAKPQKGGDLLPKALVLVKEKYPEIHLYISGSVPRTHILRKQVKDLNLSENVTFMGHMTHRNHCSLVNSVDALVLPSRSEGHPLAVLEAMALGKPIIAARIEALERIIVDGRNGLLVDHKPSEIAEAVIRLLTDESVRQRMSINNQKDIIELDWDHVVQRYVRFYQDIIQGKDKRLSCN